MDGFAFVHRDTVRFRDVDAWGHVNNAVYLTYCEDARMAYLTDLGVLTGIDDATMILARAEIDFRSPTRVGEELAVGVRTSRMGTKSFDLEYEVRAGAALRLVAESRSVLVAYDYERHRAMEIPASWRSILAGQIEASEIADGSGRSVTSLADMRGARSAYVIGGGTREKSGFPRESEQTAKPS